MAQYANKLLKKPDQSRMVTLCAHLFDPKHKAGPMPEGADAATSAYYSEPDRVLECMQRSLKVASVSNTSLFVEILDRYVYFFERENPAIKVSYLSGLVALINEQVMGAGAETPASPAVEAHYSNIIGKP